jgi:hypothetical protein
MACAKLTEVALKVQRQPLVPSAAAKNLGL